MSELRKFLRYEISGLWLFIFTSLFLFTTLGSECPFPKYLIDNPNSISGIVAAIAVIAFPVGWFVYQIYDSIIEYLYDPHTSYKIVETYWQNWQKDLTLQRLDKNYYKALVDYILIDDMYKNYPFLADTIRGFWDHYDARVVVGLFTPLISIILSLIFIFFIGKSSLISISSILFLIFVVGIFYILVFLPSQKIKRQVIAQECLLICNNLYKLRLMVLLALPVCASNGGRKR